MTMGRASCSMLADVTMFGVVFQMFLHFQCAIAGKEKLGIRILVVCPVTPQCKRAELTVSMSVVLDDLVNSRHNVVRIRISLSPWFIPD